LLGIVLSVDGIVVNFFGKVSMTPIMLTLGNLTVAQRQTIGAKQLLSFVPVLRVGQIQDRTSTASSAVRRELLHAAIAICTCCLTVAAGVFTMQRQQHAFLQDFVKCDDGPANLT